MKSQDNIENIRDRLLNNTEERLSILTNICYQFVFISSISIMEGLKDPEFLDKLSGEKDIIIENFDYIINLFAELTSEESALDLEDKKNILLNVRKNHYELCQSLYGYEKETLYIGEKLEHYLIKHMDKNELYPQDSYKHEINILINRLENILFKNKQNYDTYTSIVSSTLSILPFRMSKLRYFDILRDALMDNLSHYTVSLAEEEIEMYKKTFDSSLHDNYGIRFDSYFTQIQGLTNQSIKDFGQEELEKANKNLLELFLDIQETRELLTMMGTIINRLIIVISNRDKIFITDNSRVRQLLEDWQEEKKETRIESFKDDAKNKLEKLEEDLKKNIANLRILDEELTGKKGIFDSVLNERLEMNREMLTYYNDIDFAKYEILFPPSDEKISQEYLGQLIQNLLHYMERSLISMDNIERKIRMRKLLSIPDLPFRNNEELLSYVEYSLDDRVVSKEEISYAIDMLNSRLDKFEKNNY